MVQSKFVDNFLLFGTRILRFGETDKIILASLPALNPDSDREKDAPKR